MVVMVVLGAGCPLVWDSPQKEPQEVPIVSVREVDFPCVWYWRQPV